MDIEKNIANNKALNIAYNSKFKNIPFGNRIL